MGPVIGYKFSKFMGDQTPLKKFGPTGGIFMRPLLSGLGPLFQILLTTLLLIIKVVFKYLPSTVYIFFFNPLDTKAFGTTSETKGGGGRVGPTPLLSHNSLDLGT